MKRLFQILFFILFSIIEVRVKADYVTLPKDLLPAQEPEGCIEKMSMCAIKSARDTRYPVHVGQHEIVLGSDSGLQVQERNEVVLLGGNYFIKTLGELKVNIPSGSIVFVEAKALVSFVKGRVTVRAIEGEVRLEPIGTAEPILVKPGTENWMGGVQKKNRLVSTGIPILSGLSSLMEDWAKLHEGPKTEFKEQFFAFKKVWNAAIDETTVLVKEKAAREVATYEEERRRKLRDAAVRREEEKLLRRLFWEKTFEIEQSPNVHSGGR